MEQDELDCASMDYTKCDLSFMVQRYVYWRANIGQMSEVVGERLNTLDGSVVDLRSEQGQTRARIEELREMLAQLVPVINGMANTI